MAVVCAVLAGCGEETKPTPPASGNPPASELFDKKEPPPRAKGKAGGG